MNKVLYSAVAVAALLCASALPSRAATVILVGAGGDITGTQASLQAITGLAEGVTALSYTSDYLEFTVAPTGTVTSLEIVDLGTTYPGETFKITADSASGAIILGPTAVTGSTGSYTTTDVVAGTDYFLDLASNTPAVFGLSSFQLTVPGGGGPTPTPLPGALGLFAGGLGLLGFATMRKRRKSTGTLPFAAAI